MRQLMPKSGVHFVNIFFQWIIPAAIHAAQKDAFSADFKGQLPFTFSTVDFGFWIHIFFPHTKLLHGIYDTLVNNKK
jgi:hypothetical protein